MPPSESAGAAGPATGFMIFFFVALSTGIYAEVVRRIRLKGGAVSILGWDLPDVLVAIVLSSALAALSAKAALSPHTAPETADKVLPNAVMYLVILSGVLGFLAYRRINLVELFGIKRTPFLQVVGWAIVLLLAAVPFLAVINAATVSYLQEKAVHQPLVDLFREAAASGDLGTVAKILFVGVLVAPVCEEFLFRGFFYGVGKRYMGPLLSGLIGGLLFAAMHVNLASFPSLFALAIFLTLAYEFTGSIFVNIAMHALFNGSQLFILYLVATGRVKV